METHTHKDSEQAQDRRAEGGCLCGAVKYSVQGKLYNVINCHCSKCRRIHGHFAAFASAKRKNFKLEKQEGLKWYHSEKDETLGITRGFCKECGSSLFWDACGDDYVYISAGSLKQPTGLKTVGHIWLEQSGDYYQLTDDIDKYQKDSDGKLVGNED